MIKSKNTTSKGVYTVVRVFRGVAESAQSFKRHKDALHCLKQFRKELNPDEDDVQIFENDIID